MRQVVIPLIEHGVLPSRLPDAEWLAANLRRDDREPLMLGLGETWDRTPPQLIAALRDVPASAHGYQLSMYGLPRLRAALADYLRETHRLEACTAPYEVAVSWTGTRLVMRDFAELTVRRHPGLAGTEALVVGPSWDYAGVIEPAGWRVRHLVGAPGRWVPTPDALREHEATARGRIGLVVVNAQHNPTGYSWDIKIVRALLDLAIRHRAAVLIDDAYYGFMDPASRPTSALQELLNVPEAAELPWCAVRSLGKQFNCNGWGIGAVVARPELLAALIAEVRASHTYNIAGMLQHAMATWLEDGRAVADYLAEERLVLAASRAAALGGLGSGGVVRSSIAAGPAGPYAVYPIPAGWTDVTGYLERCALDAGVLMSNAWPAARELGSRPGRWARMYLGPGPEMVSEACTRLHSAGLFGEGEPI